MMNKAVEDPEHLKRKAAADFDPAWIEEFEAAARRPLAQRMKYAFIKTYKPVLDDSSFLAFDTMEDYRCWREENLPDWLGYGRQKVCDQSLEVS